MQLRLDLRDLVYQRLFFLLLLLGWFAFAGTAHAQEFDCSVGVDYSSISGSDFNFLDDLERRVDEYINQNRWTDDRFQPHERIQCDVQIVIQDAPTQSTFEAQIIISSRRPIYGTVQATPVIRVSDSNWRFSYSQGQSLTYNLNQHDDLTSVLDFYMYLLLGYDYDTFSEQGGTPHFETARRIKERADAAGAQGWSTVGGRDREEIISDILDSRFERLREAYFIYHFSAIDRFLEDPDEARAAVIEALEYVEDLFEDVSRRYVIDLFFSLKHSEIKAILNDGPEASEAYQILSRIDPSHDYSPLVD